MTGCVCVNNVDYINYRLNVIRAHQLTCGLDWLVGRLVGTLMALFHRNYINGRRAWQVPFLFLVLIMKWVGG